VKSRVTAELEKVFDMRPFHAAKSSKIGEAELRALQLQRMKPLEKAHPHAAA
jgi:hypothetical protein